MKQTKNGLRPPKPVGEPFRGNPADVFPFPVTGLGGVPVPVPAIAPVPVPAAAVPMGHLPVFNPPAVSAGRSPEYRAARVALGLGLASLLVLPLVLGPIAIVLGVRSLRAGERKLGHWAISAGVAGTVLGVVGLILWATGVIPSIDELLKAS